MKRRSRRAFGLALGLSLFVFLAVGGCVVVDVQGRALSFGDHQPPFQVVHTDDGQAQLEVKLFGVEKELPFTQGDKLLRMVGEFFCLPSV